MWLLAGYPIAAADQPVFAVAGWVLSGVAFGAHARSPRRLAGCGWLAVQAAASIALAYATASFRSGAMLLIVVAAQLPVRLVSRWVLLWIVAQTGLLTGLFLATIGASITGVAAAIAAQLFAAGTAALAESERVAREELLETHKQLEQFQALRLQGARQAERLRIARDLHDGLGHRLTALGLALEAARHTGASPSLLEHIARARALAGTLLDELRRTVTDMREADAGELTLLLEGLGRAVPTMAVDVHVDEGLTIENAETAGAIYRICQEVVTNAARHSGGTRVALALSARHDQVVVHGRDNGRGAGSLVRGSGLLGIAERAQLLGGTAEFQPTSGGFSVVVRFPKARLQ